MDERTATLIIVLVCVGVFAPLIPVMVVKSAQEVYWSIKEWSSHRW